MKKVTTLILTTVISLFSAKSYAAFTQMWMQQYQHTTATGYSNESRKVVEDLSGNIYILNDVTSNLDSNGIAQGGTHHYTSIIKYSAGGVRLNRISIEVFNHTISGSNNLGAFGLELDANANVYVGYTPYNASTNFNVAIAKYDSSLNRIWLCQYVSPANDQGVEMKLSPAGMVYFVQKTINGGNTTYSVFKTNSGNLPTLIHTFAANTEVISSLALGTNDDVYVTGYRIVSGAKAMLFMGIDRINYLVKWTTVYNGGFTSGDDYGTSVAVAPDGNIYALGTSTQGGTHGTDMVIMKHVPGAATKLSWFALLNYDVNDFAAIISVPEVDYAYVSGTSDDKVVLYRLNVLSRPNVQIASIYHPDPVAAHVSVGSATVTAMKVSASKKVYIAGGVTATNLSGQIFSAFFLAKFGIVFGTVPTLLYNFPCTGDFATSYKATSLTLDYAKTDIYMSCDKWSNYSTHASEYSQLYDIDVSAPLRQSSENSVSLDISVFPNPASEKITIRANEGMSYFMLSDMTGKVVKYSTGNSKMEIELSVADLKSGIYLCKVLTDSGGVILKKLMVE